MQYHAIPCIIMQYHEVLCSTMQYHAIPCNTMQCHAIPCNILQYHAIPGNTMQYHTIPCNTMQYHAIPDIINSCWRSVGCGQYKAIFFTIKLGTGTLSSSNKGKRRNQIYIFGCISIITIIEISPQPTEKITGGHNSSRKFFPSSIASLSSFFLFFFSSSTTSPSLKRSSTRFTMSTTSRLRTSSKSC